MPDNEIADILDSILECIKLIQERFSQIQMPDDFVKSSNGVTLLDAISMRLQVIGELVKRIQKIDPSLLDQYPVIKWDSIARFRDLVSHHYEHVDYEIVYDICDTHIPKLKEVIQRMRIAPSA